MGYGKTYLIAALCRAYRGSGIVVTTKSATVVKRLVDGLTELLKDDGITVGIRQGAKFKPGDVTVCTNAVLDRFAPEAVGCLIYDEVHHAAARLQIKMLTKFHNSVKFGLSGTVGDRFDGRHHLIEGIFGTVCSTVTDQEAEEMGRVVPLKVFVVPVERGPDLSEIQSSITAERRGIWRNAHRNKLVAAAADKVPPEWQTIVFVRTLEHAEILAENYLSEDFELFHSDLPPEEYTRILSGFESDSFNHTGSPESRPKMWLEAPTFPHDTS
jgi:superfamily II DNA or RNA helicase